MSETSVAEDPLLYIFFEDPNDLMDARLSYFPCEDPNNH
ncbi:hypothetical protein SLEP1_g42434 [Rubroshorea leprosula]|uniref:Uncharacterized protein n=1 Tax=Rubroshorea leprosula TaxID=152421 RepID=A0AAV5LAA8_9ROSI|nr:hypothetical protein SLEP1_g42434 [Rubroshorea leprosula]